jgi:hypothetical protein
MSITTIGVIGVGTIGPAAVYVGGLADGGRLMQLGGHLSLLHVLKQD